MELKHIKLRTGEDLLGYTEFVKNELGKTMLIVTAPISVHIDPTRGLFAKSWLFLSENNYADISMNDVMHLDFASSKAIENYDYFADKHMREDTYEEENDISDEQIETIEDLFQAILDSKTKTLH